MIPFISAAIGKLNTLLTRVPSDNATRVAYLDASILSRAPSSTALSTSVWTQTHADRLAVLRPPFMTDPRMARVQFVGHDWFYAHQGNSGYQFSVGTTWHTGSNKERACTHSASVATADTYVEVVNITSGGGWCGCVIGPNHSTLTLTTTMEITVDGTVYTMSAATGSNSRLVWNAARSDDLQGSFERLTSLGQLMDGATGAASYNNILRFNTSLKIQVKVDLLPTNSANNRVCAAHVFTPSLLTNSNGTVTWT